MSQKLSTPHIVDEFNLRTGQSNEILTGAPVAATKPENGFAPELTQARVREQQAKHAAEQAAIAAARAATGEPDPVQQEPLSELDELKARVARLEQAQASKASTR